MSNKVPIVAIVGRANVGKSSLFNAIIGRREAIVAKEAGTTRDSITAKASVFVPDSRVSHLDAVQGSKEERERRIKYGERVIDAADAAMRQEPAGAAGSAGRQGKAVRGFWKDFWLVDTAGMKSAEDEFELSIQEQIIEAADSASLIAVVVEADVLITEEDRRVATLALKSKRPVILVVNKIDKNQKADLSDWLKLGIKKVLATSATQKRGINEVLREISLSLPPAKIRLDENRIRLSLLGRPNVGKSSLFNTLANKQQASWNARQGGPAQPIPLGQAIVSERAGTTRDINRLVVRYHSKEIELMDTAGIRRAGKIERGVEQFSVLRALSAIEQSDISLLIMDVNELGTQLDQKIAGLAKEAGNGLILAITKWDSYDKDAFSRDQLAAQVAAEFVFVPWAPLVFTSAVTGQNVAKIFELVLEIANNKKQKFKTTELNRWLQAAIHKHPPAGLKGRLPKLNYMVQEEDMDMPSFKIFGAHTKFLHWSYKRYLERSFREKWPLMGTPLKFWFIEKNRN